MRSVLVVAACCVRGASAFSPPCRGARAAARPSAAAGDAADSSAVPDVVVSDPEVLVDELDELEDWDMPGMDMPDDPMAGLGGLGGGLTDIGDGAFDIKSYLKAMEANNNKGAAEGEGEGYRWTQDFKTMNCIVDGLPEDTRHFDVTVEFPTTASIIIAVKGVTLLEGALGGDINRDETFWVLEDDDEDDAGSRRILIDIVKVEAEDSGAWTGFLASEAPAMDDFQMPDMSAFGIDSE